MKIIIRADSVKGPQTQTGVGGSTHGKNPVPLLTPTTDTTSSAAAKSISVSRSASMHAADAFGAAVGTEFTSPHRARPAARQNATMSGGYTRHAPPCHAPTRAPLAEAPSGTEYSARAVDGADPGGWWSFLRTILAAPLLQREDVPGGCDQECACKHGNGVHARECVSVSDAV
jgi:hypothetical protein